MAKITTTPTAEELLALIRQYCLSCSGGSRKEVEQCHIKTCPFYPYRNNRAMGRAATPKKCKGQLTMDSLLKQSS